MITILLSSLQKREGQIIQTAFEQFGYEIINITLNFENYLKCLKVNPDIILIDITQKCEQEMKLIQNIKKHPSHKEVIILGYGPTDIQARSHSYNEKLFDYYFYRPLKFSKILKKIKDLKPSEVDEIEANIQAIREQSDIEVIRDTRILPSTKLGMIVQHSTKILAFPFTLPKILAITNDPGSGARELAKMVETDPVVSAKVLKTANTIFYSARDHRVIKMRDAIVRIGFEETKRVVLCIEVMKLFENKQRNYGFDRKQFWLHSIAVAIVTEVLFSKGAFKQLSEHAFLAGLLHDLGTIVLDEFLPEIFSEALEKTVSTSGSFSSTFGEEYGFFPAMITKAFMDEWNFHSIIKDSINFKGVTTDKVETSSMENQLQQALLVAHIFVKSHQIGRSCDQVIDIIPPQILKNISLNSTISQATIEQIYFKINEMCRLLNLDPSIVRKQTTTTISREVEQTITFFAYPGLSFSPHLEVVKLLEYNVRIIVSTEQLEAIGQTQNLLIIWLNTLDEENISDFLSSIDFENTVNGNCLIITKNVELVMRKVNAQHTSVIPSEIDARLLSKVIHAYMKQ